MHDDEAEFPERDALAALRRDVPPSDVLEERTVRALTARGLLQRSSRRTSGVVARVAAIAACVLFFLGGYVVGTRRTGSPGDSTTIYSGELRDEPIGGVSPAESLQSPASTEVTFAAPDSAAAASRRVVWF